MKKYLVIILILIVLPINAQDRIDKSRYDKLIDYIACRYTIVYFDSLESKGTYYPDKVKIFNENIRDKIKDGNYNSSVNIDSLYSLLKTYKMKTADELVKKLDKRKGYYNEEWSNLQCIQTILSLDSITSDVSEYLYTVKGNLETKLQTDFPDKRVEQTDIVSKLQPSRRKNRAPAIEKINLIPYISILVSLIVLVILINRTGKLRERVIKIVHGSRRIQDFIKMEISQQLSNSNHSYSNNNILKEADIDRIAEQVYEKIKNEKKLFSESDGNIGGNNIVNENLANNSIESPKEIAPPPPMQVKYLKQRDGNMFNLISSTPDGCYFKMFDIIGALAKFSFEGDEDYAISNKNEVFDEVCEVAGSSFNAKSIVNIESGEIEKQVNGKYRVIKKAKVKFI